ncbi:unnamed protein product, partial [Tilletia caries]
ITKESNNKFNTLTVSLPVGMNPDADHDIEAIATAFGAQTLEAPLLINVTAWHGYANPRLTVQNMTKFLNEAEIPENFPIPVGRICGVGKVLETNSTEGWLRIYTVSFDRVVSTSPQSTRAHLSRSLTSRMVVSLSQHTRRVPGAPSS